jgi:hypothetical protein
MQLASAALQENKSAPICDIFKAKKSTCSKQVTVGVTPKCNSADNGSERKGRSASSNSLGPVPMLTALGCALIEEWRIVNPLG